MSEFEGKIVVITFLYTHCPDICPAITYQMNKLSEELGDEFGESKIYRIRFTDLLDWILEIPNFEGKREDCSEGHLEQIQAKWVYEWRDNQ